MRKFAICLMFALLTFGAAAHAQSEDPATLFKQANDFYEQRDYASAVRLYEAILSQGVASADVYYNLGNAYFKQGDLGHAVVNYLRARRLDPSDPDVRQNLQFARQYTRVQMEGVRLNPVSGFIESLIDPYALTTMAWVASLLFILFLAILIVRFGLGFRGAVLRVATIVVLVLAVAAAGLTTFKYRIEYLSRRAVIVAEDAPILSGPTESADLEFQGSPGLVVTIVGESGDYYSVLFENKRRGWVNKDLLAEV